MQKSASFMHTSAAFKSAAFMHTSAAFKSAAVRDNSGPVSKREGAAFNSAPL